MVLFLSSDDWEEQMYGVACEYLSRSQTMSYMYRYIIVHALVHICVFVRVRFTCKSLFFSSGAGSSGMGIAGGGFVRRSTCTARWLVNVFNCSIVGASP